MTTREEIASRVLAGILPNSFALSEYFEGNQDNAQLFVDQATTFSVAITDRLLARLAGTAPTTDHPNGESGH